MVPFPIDGIMNTLIGHLKEYLMGELEPFYPLMVASLSTGVAALAIIARLLRPDWITKDEVLHENLEGGPLWFFSRLLAPCIALSVYFGSRHYIGTDTLPGLFLANASFIVHHIAPRLIVLAVLLGLWAPLIMDFGLVRFIAVYASPVMRPLFKVPGRSAVDCVASWLGSSSMAVVFTAKMYDAGAYTAREAASIVCGFSLAGIYNIYAVAEMLNLEYLISYILAVSYGVMIILAAILPRIWPLSSVPESYIGGRDTYKSSAPELRHNCTMFQWALLRATNRAQKMTARHYLQESKNIICALLFSTVPLMITFGTLLTFISETTAIVSFFAEPFALLLRFAGAAEADIIGKTVVFAFVDQFLAVTYGRMLLTEQSRFICICLTICGLINLTEVGLHVWHSNIPLRFWQMTAVYIIRIVISIFLILPAAALLVH